MRVPLSWLYEYCDPKLDAAALAERLALTGTEVDRIESVGLGSSDGFVVGRVIEAEKHPQADRLKVCRVDVGESQPRQIICGAPNVAAGQTVAVALPGAIMPDGSKLKSAKLRGIESSGMLMSESELGLSSDHSGILVLESGTPGRPLDELFPTRFDVLELEITPNRGDCLSIYGVAREVHAATAAPLAELVVKPIPAASEPPEVVAAIEDAELCPRLMTRVFDNVTIAPSPLWLKAKLASAGQRSINNVVDITNYVLLLVGHPLHAFDADRIEGSRLVVRRAKAGERLRTLDGVDRELDASICVICDDLGPASLAGVMGGERTEVSGQTTRVVLEAATWSGPNIQATAAKLGLRSEASARFEKDLPVESVPQALALASQLIEELAGGVAGTISDSAPQDGTTSSSMAQPAPAVGAISAKGSQDGRRSSKMGEHAASAGETISGNAPQDGPNPPPIVLRLARVERLLGTPIAADDCVRILRSLDFKVTSVDGELTVEVPPFRRKDVTREIDLIEEIARIWGLDRLPASLPKRRGPGARLSHAQICRRRAETLLANRGLSEIVGWSFAAPGFADQLGLAPDDPRRNLLTLRNPLSEDQSVMRTMMLPSVLQVAQLNRSRGAESIRLFEFGTVFGRDGDGDPVERTMLGGYLSGVGRPRSWQDDKPPAIDFYSAKATIAALFDRLGVLWSVASAREPFLHPGKSAQIMVGDRLTVGEPVTVGWLGELHPDVIRSHKLAGGFVFEIDFDRLVSVGLPQVTYVPIPTHPPVEQDIALIVDDAIPAADIIDLALSAGVPEVSDIQIFDLYRSMRLGEGKKSLALRITFRANDRTLTDEEVGAIRNRVVEAAHERFGAELRDA